MIICGQHFTTETIAWIKKIIKANPTISRTELSRRVCGKLDWRRKNHKLKEMSCRKALLKLDKNGLIKLPEIKRRITRNTSGNDKTNYLPKLSVVNTSLSNLGSIEIITVDSSKKQQYRIWCALMDNYHYLGSGPFCGAQMRYLVKSSIYGYLGAFAFTSAAWRLSSRDEWIGWNNYQRKANLEKIVSNSRFLILPQVQVPNLASYLLARCLKQLPHDWHRHYGYHPVLVETFVEQKRFAGTSYLAANWIKLGATKGRGRQDHNHNAHLSIKDIFVYPLVKNVRSMLCTPTPALVSSTNKEPAQTLTWEMEEFGQAKLEDRRLNKRLRLLAKDFLAKPGASIPLVCGSRAKTKAAYRFFDHNKTTMEKILEPHYKATTKRIRDHDIVLTVQDSTKLDYSAHPATGNLGPIGFSKNGKVGLIVHDTMAFSTTGTPLGLIDVQCWARNPLCFGKKAYRSKLPIEAKESNKWLNSFKASARVNSKCNNTTIVSIGDREADIYELFTLAAKDPKGPKLLIRASHNRYLVKEQQKLLEKLAQISPSGIKELYLPKKGNQRPRIAKMQIRFMPALLKPPTHKKGLKPVRVWVISANEIDCPSDKTPLKWTLLTTIKINSFKQACEILGWYSLRWGIEVYHYTLKSGCNIEERQLGHANRIETCLAIDMVVAWRIYHLTRLGRQSPNVKCSVFFKEEEWKALLAFVNKDPIPPEKPPTLRTAIRMVASLGGFLGRKGDGEPGVKTTWRGLQRLDDITIAWKVFVPQSLKIAVSSKMDYG